MRRCLQSNKQLDAILKAPIAEQPQAVESAGAGPSHAPPVQKAGVQHKRRRWKPRPAARNAAAGPAQSSRHTAASTPAETPRTDDAVRHLEQQLGTLTSMVADLQKSQAGPQRMDTEDWIPPRDRQQQQWHNQHCRY